jgi:hypothetical protein
MKSVNIGVDTNQVSFLLSSPQALAGVLPGHGRLDVESISLTAGHLPDRSGRRFDSHQIYRNPLFKGESKGVEVDRKYVYPILTHARAVQGPDFTLTVYT